MTFAATDLTGWQVGYVVGVVVVAAVAVLLLLIIAAARRIAAVAEDATRSLVEAQQRTEALWDLETTNEVVGEILDGAAQARKALGG